MSALRSGLARKGQNVVLPEVITPPYEKHKYWFFPTDLPLSW